MKINTDYRFGELLKQFRVRAGLSQTELAQDIKVRRNTIGNWERGETLPQERERILMLAEVLRLTEAETDSLLYGADYPLTGGKKIEPAATGKPPFQAVRDIAHFVGREGLLTDISAILLGGEMVTLQGMGGVGKTALATRLAYRLRPKFPDGVLWARLDTTDSMTTLSAFAGAYGQTVSQQTDLTSRSSLVRGILADKRVLIILDNAETSQQVRPLLPPTTGQPAVIMTTRHDLSVSDGSKRYAIKPFSPASGHALALFSHLLEAPYVNQYQADLLEIADLLGHLPLAINIAAARLAYEPDAAIADFVDQIRQQESRLDELIREDRDVRLSFGVSYNALPAQQQAFFAALGVFGGRDFSTASVAAITQLSEREVTQRLRDLARLSLINTSLQDRYSIHPLLQDYAREKIIGSAIHERMVSYFSGYISRHAEDYDAIDLEVSNIQAALQTAHERQLIDPFLQAVNELYDYLDTRGQRDLTEHYLGLAQQNLPEYAAPGLKANLLICSGDLFIKQGRLAEADNVLQAAVDPARQTGDSRLLSRLWSGLGRTAVGQGDYTRAETAFQEGLSMTRQSENDPLLSDILGGLAQMAAFAHTDYVRAERYLQESLAAARQIGHPTKISVALLRLGSVAYEQGDWPAAETYFQQALTQAQTIGDLQAQTNALHNLGVVTEFQGKTEEAKAHLKAGLKLARQINNRDVMVLSLTTLGQQAVDQNDFSQAEAYYQESLTLSRTMDHPANITFVLTNLGHLATLQENYEQAETYVAEGMSLARQTGQPWDMATVLIRWGELCLAQGKTAEAQTTLEQVIGMAREGGMQEMLAEALFGLARTQLAQGDSATARRTGEEGLAVFEKLGHRLQHEVRIWLAELSAG